MFYRDQEVSSLPDTVRRFSRGCGNPVNLADLESGDSVVDLGCGAGLDALLAANLVGEEGRITGIDIDPEMIDRAGQAVNEAGLGSRNIFFKVDDIEKSPHPKNYAEVLISNYVFSSCADKGMLFTNIFRILRPGGRLVFADIVLVDGNGMEIPGGFTAENPLPAWAVTEERYLDILKKKCFYDIQVLVRHPLSAVEMESLLGLPGRGIGENLKELDGRVVAVVITAMRPRLN